jgi:hypothetical protein
MAYMKYPVPDDMKSGCKVGWYYYCDLEKARACSEAAINNAKRKQNLGYDFGYCSPGSIEITPSEACAYKVCIP